MKIAVLVLVVLSGACATAEPVDPTEPVMKEPPRQSLDAVFHLSGPVGCEPIAPVTDLRDLCDPFGGALATGEDRGFSMLCHDHADPYAGAGIDTQGFGTFTVIEAGRTCSYKISPQ